MFKTILIDDEKLSLEQLSYVLGRQQDITISGAYTDPLEALAAVKEINPDILFIDVTMPCINGFQLAREVQDEGLQPYIIFVTAYREYAINAFEVEAVDYIQKPFLGDRVNHALEKVRKRSAGINGVMEQFSRKETGSDRDQSTTGEERFNPDSINWFPVEENESIVLLHAEDVQYCTVDGKTTIIHTSISSHPIAYTLSKIEEHYCSKLFFRCHKSFIVNLNHVERIMPLFKQNHVIKLKNSKVEIPVSRHYVKKLKILLNLDGSGR